MKQLITTLFGVIALAACGNKPAEQANIAENATPNKVTYIATSKSGKMDTLVVDFTNTDTAVFYLNGKTYELPIAKTASGFEYKNATADLLGEGNLGFLTLSNGDNFSLIQRLTEGKLQFDLSENNFGQLRMVTHGLTEQQDTLTAEIKDGYQVTKVKTADLNKDGYPEVYVVLSSIKNEPSQLIAYSSNKNASMTDIVMPEVDKKKHADYQGQDDITVESNGVVRSYPTKDGKTASISYTLQKGEAAWQLVETNN